MAALQKVEAELTAANASVVGISVDTSEESKLMAEELGLSFPLLADPSASVIEKYGVKMAHEQLAVPAVFVLRPDGAIAWRFVSKFKAERPASEVVLEVLENLDAPKQN